MAVAQQHPSLDRFLRLPEQKPALEYLDGVITQKMSPKAAHSII
jgi:Uma2 family endonuclease